MVLTFRRGIVKMFDTLFQVADWVKWIGVAGIFLGILAFFFAPSIAGVIGEFLKPVAKGLGEWLTHAAKNAFDTVSGIVLVGVLLFGTAYYFNRSCDCKPVVEKAIKDLRKDYRFVPKKQESKSWFR